MAHFRIDWDESERKNFPDTLRKYRINRKFTQARLAKKVGVKNTTISNYENGVSLPDIDTLLKITRVLNVDPGEFFVDWRFRDSENYDMVPNVVHVESNLVTRTYTKWFVALPVDCQHTLCRAWIVPEKYLQNGDKKLHFVTLSPFEKYSEGDVVVGIADKVHTYLGVYHIDENGDVVINPIKRWNPDFSEGLRTKLCASFQIIGKVISYSYQEIVI